MEYTSWKIEHLFWNQVGWCVLESGCAPKGIGRRNPWQEKDKNHQNVQILFCEL